MLGDLPIPDNKDDALEFLGFNKNPYDVTVVVSFIQDVLLYNKGYRRCDNGAVHLKN